MNFTSIPFLALFLPAAFLSHSLCRTKTAANRVLLLFSLVFYGCYGIKYLLFLAFSTLLTFFGGLYGHRFLTGSKEKQGKAILICCLIANILMLLVCKYTNFALENMNMLLSRWGIAIAMPSILLPVGLSFYVFQSSAYLLEILFGRLEPEQSPVSYGLFVTFFPTITSGPIQRPGDLLPQINRRRSLSWDQFRYAFLLFLWGAFLKMVVADRLATFTDTVFTNYWEYGIFVLFPAMCAYAVQIYGDFAGYSYMAIAIAVLFGFTLKPNFLRPYAARSIGEFWRRWHISLSSWFRDYIYIPLGGNRKGAFRKYVNLTIVFLVSGLWHGASWGFILWGGIHAFYQVFGSITKPWRTAIARKLHIETDCFSFRLFQRAVVFLLVSVAWVFFRLPNAQEAFGFLLAMKRIMLVQLLEWHPAALGLDAITLLAVGVLLLISVLQELGMDFRFFLKQNLLFRWICYSLLIAVIILFGAYGPAFSASAFIYAGF